MRATDSSCGIDGRPASHRLSRAEARVLAYTAAGYTTAEIARLRGVGLQTVKSQRERVRRKLGARNTTHAVALACTSGLIGAETLRRVAVIVGARR